MTRARRTVIAITVACAAAGLGGPALAATGAEAATPASSPPASVTPHGHGICVASVYSPLLNFCEL